MTGRKTRLCVGTGYLLKDRVWQVADFLGATWWPAEGSQLVVSGAAVAKHVASIVAKLGLAVGEENRRVKAVLEYLSGTSR